MSSNGDVAITGDNVFSFSTIAVATTSGTLSIPVTVTDAQSDSTATSISLTINLPVATVPLHTIQGSKSLTATSVSPFAGQMVTTEGVVASVKLLRLLYPGSGFRCRLRSDDAGGHLHLHRFRQSSFRSDDRQPRAGHRHGRDLPCGLGYTYSGNGDRQHLRYGPGAGSAPAQTHRG